MTKVIIDFLLNIFSSLIYVGILQGVVYPFLAQSYSPSIYGDILILMGIMNTIIGTLGGPLNNARLIVNSEYKKENLVGDFQILLICTVVVGGVMQLITAFNIVHDSTINIIIIVLTLIISIAKNYYQVAYRIVINYRKNLTFNVVLSLGYILGLFTLNYIKNWPIVFLIGEITGIIYILATSNIAFERFAVTFRFTQTTKKYFTLVFTGLIANLLVYLDRLLINPVLGSGNVAIYTVASFFGKTLGMVLIPIAGVLLSYYAKENFSMNKKTFNKINFLTFGVGIAFFLFSIVAGKWVTGLFYPTLIGDANQYIVLANMASIIGIVGNMAQPALMCFCNIRWQLIIQIIYGIIYVTAGIFLMNIWGLLGFCIAAIVSNSIRLIVMYLVGNYNLSKN